MHRPRHSVLIHFILQFGRLSPVAEETALYNGYGRFYMEKEVIISICLGLPTVLLSQNIIKTLLENFRQRFSFL